MARATLSFLSLPLILSAQALGGCDGGSSGSSGAGATTSTSTPSGGAGGTTSTGGTSTGGSGGSGGTTSSMGGSGGATTSSSSTSMGGSGPACGAFARGYGSSGMTDTTTVTGVAVDPDGGAIVIGDFAGTIQIGGASLTSAGAQDGFVAKLGPGGGVLWAKRFGAVFDDLPKAVIAMPDGGAVIAGTFDGVVDFFGETRTSIAGPDAFVLRLDADGALVFVQQMENADARSAARADNGDLLIAGDFTGSTAIDGLPMTADGTVDLLVARLTPDGSLAAARHVGLSVKPGALAIAAGAGRTYLAGSFQGTIDLGTGALTSAGARDVLVARLDDALGTAFARRFGDDSSQEARALAVLSDGSVAITGGFKSALDFDGTTLVADTLDDVFVARLDDAGSVVFAKRFGDAEAQIGRAIAVNGSDELLIAGGFAGSLDAGDGAITSAGGEDVFLVRLDATGAALKSERWGAALDQRGRSISVDPCGAVLLGGTMNGPFSFDADALDVAGSQDGFVARRAP